MLSSCNEYQKALKATDIGAKFKMGDSLFQAGKYTKANRLFEQIVPSYRGKPQAQKLMYMHAMSFYMTRDYYLAGYQFERFAKSYPQSEKLEEAFFLSAKSKYMLSPVYTKDQEETKEAIEKLQLFINDFSESEYVGEANKLVKELDFKLEKKSFEVAKQYNKIYDYRASIKAFDNFLVEYPGSKLREEALYYRLHSATELAINSVPWKKEERLNNAKGYHEAFKKAFPNSGFIAEADKMLNQLDEELLAYNTKS
jgi:outer membrane protein assembly factor BamD